MFRKYYPHVFEVMKEEVYDDLKGIIEMFIRDKTLFIQTAKRTYNTPVSEIDGWNLNCGIRLRFDNLTAINKQLGELEPTILSQSATGHIEVQGYNSLEAYNEWVQKHPVGNTQCLYAGNLSDVTERQAQDWVGTTYHGNWYDYRNRAVVFHALDALKTAVTKDYIVVTQLRTQ